MEVRSICFLGPCVCVCVYIYKIHGCQIKSTCIQVYTGTSTLFEKKHTCVRVDFFAFKICGWYQSIELTLDWNLVH